jgi:hypothetical protein
VGYIILPLKINKILLVENLIQVKLKNTIINCGKLICNTSSQQSFYLAREHHFKLHNLYGYCFVCQCVTVLCFNVLLLLLFCMSRWYCFVARCYCFVCQCVTVVTVLYVKVILWCFKVHTVLYRCDCNSIFLLFTCGRALEQHLQVYNMAANSWPFSNNLFYKRKIQTLTQGTSNICTL